MKKKSDEVVSKTKKTIRNNRSMKVNLTIFFCFIYLAGIQLVTANNCYTSFTQITQGNPLPRTLEQKFSDLQLPSNIALSIVHGKQKAFQGNRANPFIGISMGMTPIDSSIAKNYIQIALDSTDGTIPILIGDKLDRYNQFAFAGKSLISGKAEEVALKSGDRYKAMLKEAIESFPPEDKRRLKIIRWQDILTEEYQLAVEAVKNEFSSNPNFKAVIEQTAQNFFNRRARGKTPKPERIEALQNYILEEIPVLLKGLKTSDDRYATLLHPVFTRGGQNIDNPLTELIKSILEDPNYANLRSALQIEQAPGLVDIIFITPVN